MPTKQISPAASPSSSSSPSAAPSSNEVLTTFSPKKSVFRRRKRTSSNTVPTYTRSLSSSQLSLEEAIPKKKKSLLKRLLKYSGGGSSSKSMHKQQLIIATHPEVEEDDDDTEERCHLDNGEEEEAIALDSRACDERNNELYEQAMATWTQALALVKEVRLTHQIKCRMISLHLFLHASSSSELHLERANQLISELEPLEDDDGAALALEGSPLLLELLMKHSCWALALQVSHSMPHMDPLVLARLHLEVALEGGEEAIEKYHDEEDELDDPLLGEKRFQQLSHLSECHQLLLSLHANANETTYQTLWQELAQAYGVMGEDELALGCSQSRLSHLTSPLEVALAHYDQALNVLAPVGQYELALKEAELALDTLQRAFSPQQPASTNTILADTKEGVEEGDEVDLLWIRLYQFKADVLCRMGRLMESIHSYERLLQCYKSSSTHGPADAANVLYILGKLSVRAKQFHAALDYFDEELTMTKSVVGHTHLAISKILHESARVADAGMMDYPRAVRYYQEALQVETRVYQQSKQENGTSLLQDAKAQMGETKQCLGKLHFKMGDFTKAMKTTLAVDK